jgi:hypothetical protein
MRTPAALVRRDYQLTPDNLSSLSQILNRHPRTHPDIAVRDGHGSR